MTLIFFSPMKYIVATLLRKLYLKLHVIFFFILMLNPCGWIMSREVDNKQKTMKILV